MRLNPETHQLVLRRAPNGGWTVHTEVLDRSDHHRRLAASVAGVDDLGVWLTSLDIGPEPGASTGPAMRGPLGPTKRGTILANPTWPPHDFGL